MLDFCPNTRLQMLQLFCHATQFVLERSLAFGALHDHVPRHRFANVLGVLFHALVPSVAQRSSLVTMQQRVCRRDAGDVASCTDNSVDQTRSGTDTDVCFHAKVPVIAFLRVVSPP